MVHDNIELVDRPYGYIRIPLSRKIKFKKISFKNIYSHWKNFRLQHLKNKLEAKKEKLVEMEFSGSQLTPGKEREHVENKILRKTKAIARLESKISFLETGEYLSPEFVDSRAIKLKSMMMKNLTYNKDSLYSVTEEAAEQIMTDKTIDGVIDEETAKIGDKVKQILAEKKAKGQAPITPPVAQEKNTVSKQEPTIKKEEVESAINGATDKVNVTPTISSDAVAEAIEQEMSKIRVNSNGSSAARVNKFINEDGTYRMRREDIDEDFRITRFDKSKDQIITETPIDVKIEPEIPPFSTTKRKTPDVDIPRKAITEIVERKDIKFPEIKLPTIKEHTVEANQNEQKEAEAIREIPVVVPERKIEVAIDDEKTEKPEEIKVDENPADNYIEEAMNTPEMPRNVGALMARISILKAEKRTMDQKAEEAEKKALSVDEEYQETMRKLSEYADSLERDCNDTYQAMSQTEKSAALKEAQINAMLMMMESPETASEESVKGRVK